MNSSIVVFPVPVAGAPISHGLSLRTTGKGISGKSSSSFFFYLVDAMTNRGFPEDTLIGVWQKLNIQQCGTALDASMLIWLHRSQTKFEMSMARLLTHIDSFRSKKGVSTDRTGCAKGKKKGRRKKNNTVN